MESVILFVVLFKVMRTNQEDEEGDHKTRTWNMEKSYRMRKEEEEDQGHHQ